MKVECRITKQVFARDDYRIFGCVPTKKYDNLKLNKYGSFTITGELTYLSEGKDYTIEIEESKTDKFGTQYSVTGVPSLEVEKITDDMEYGILCEITTPSQATYINEAYPQFVQMVIQGKEEEIDHKNIYNVGEIRKAFLIREINKKFKYFLIMSNFKSYGLTIEECKILNKEYKSLEEIQDKLENKPYFVLIELLGRSFINVDKLIMSLHPELEESAQRTEHLMLYILGLNQYDGNTKINARAMSAYAKDIAPECLKNMKQVAVDSNLIYYNQENNDIARMDTYLAECEIADFIKVRIENSTQLNIDYEKYSIVDGFELTQQQQDLLKNFCEYSFTILAGYSGCVDKDTEYFDGEEWVKISDYNGGKVMQYNTETKKSTLTIPHRYIKEKCNSMYKIKSKYGADQMLSEDHKVITLSSKGNLKFEMAKDFVEKHNNHPLGINQKFMTTFEYEGTGIDLSDEEIRLMVAVMADGSFYSNGKDSKWCVINIKKDRKKERLVQLLNNAQIEFKCSESSVEGYHKYKFYAPIKTKKYPKEWYNCTKEQFKIICEEVMHWDGGHTEGNKGGQFSTSVKDDADFIQFAFATQGKRATIHERDRIGETYKDAYTRKSKEYGVTVSNTSPLVGIRVANPNKKNNIEKVQTEDGFKYCFTVDTGALVLRRNGRIFITGNCGKTSCLIGLIELLEDNKMTYTCLAPTGKASARMKECINRPTSTVHRALAGGQQITSDVVIVDEFSFFGVELMQMLIRGIASDRTRIVLCGDNAQLASISFGRVFDDMLESGMIPMSLLTRVFRYADGGILKVATDIRNGQSFLSSDPIQKFGKDYVFKQSNEPLDDAVEEYMKLVKKGIKPKDIMGLTPFNVGEFGTLNLNSIIQASVNPAKINQVSLSTKVRGHEVFFRAGDYVLNTKNNYKALPLDSWEMLQDNEELELDDVTLTTIYNGDTGYIRSVDERKVIVEINEEFIVYEKHQLGNLLLAYFITTHKAQGSQAKYVINITNPMHEKMLTRNLLYVADSRSCGYHIELGDIETINKALSIQESKARKTFLKEELIK